MTKGTKVYYSIATAIIMGLIAYNGYQGGLIAIVSSFISIIVATAIVFAIEWLRVSIDIAGGEKQIKAEIMALRVETIELKAPTLNIDEYLPYFYNTSRDYRKLWELLKTQRVICFVDDRHFPELKQIGTTPRRKHKEGYFVDIGCPGTAYITADTEEDFVAQCIDRNVEFIIPNYEVGNDTR